MMGLESLSDADLLALKSGDLSKVSDEGLIALKTPAAVSEPAKQRTGLKGIYDQVVPIVGEMIRPGGMGKLISETIDKGAYEAGAAVNDVAAKVVPPAVAAGLGYATNVGIQALPTILGGEVAKAAEPAMKAGATRLMHSAIKPSVEAVKPQQAIQTMLDEGINVSKGGINKLRGLISNLNDEIMTAIKSSPATVDKNAVASELLIPLKKFSMQVNPNSDIATIKAAWKEFVEHPLLQGDSIPVQLAQAMKQGTYQVLKGKYGEVGSAATEAQKALARGLKEGISKAVPAVEGLNARESALINALKLAERRVLVEGNKNMSGLGWLTSNPALWAAFMADRSSAFKSIVARMMYSGAKEIPATAGRAAVVGIAANNNQQ